MSINAKKNNSNHEKPAIGNVQAVCTAVHDIGVQVNKQGKEYHKVVILWEINQTIKTGEYAGKRMVQSQQYTLSMYENARLRKDLEAWRGKKFKDEDEACSLDLEKLIGANCLLNLQYSDDGRYVNIAGISPLMQGMEKMKPELPPNHVYKWIEELKKKAVNANDELVETAPICDAKPGEVVSLAPGEDPHKNDDLPF